MKSSRVVPGALLGRLERCGGEGNGVIRGARGKGGGRLGRRFGGSSHPISFMRHMRSLEPRQSSAFLSFSGTLPAVMSTAHMASCVSSSCHRFVHPARETS